MNNLTLLDQIRSLRERASSGENAISECQSDFGPAIRRIARHFLRNGQPCGEIGDFIAHQHHSASYDLDELTSQVCAALLKLTGLEFPDTVRANLETAIAG